MTAVDPLHDLIDIYSAQLGTVAECSPFTMGRYLLRAGPNIAIDGLPTGHLEIAATGYPLVQQSSWHYNVDLNPPARQYRNFMTLTLAPYMTSGTQNPGYVRIQANGLGYVPLLRNDGQELRQGDIRNGIPFIAVYINGAFYHVGLCNSQVPLVLVGAIEFWIRPDGNDATGDGTANAPDKAFRTIVGCWNAVGSRYAGSPAAHIIMRLGIPGDYEGGYFGPYGASVSLVGDRDNRAAYRILSQTYPGSELGWSSLSVANVANCTLAGINLVQNRSGSPPNGSGCLSIGTSTASLDRVQCSIEAPTPSTVMLNVGLSANCMLTSPTTGGGTDIRFVGNGHQAVAGMDVTASSIFSGSILGIPASSLHFDHINFTSAGIVVANQSQAGFANETISDNGSTGPRYTVTDHSTLRMYGNTPPGNAAGIIGPFSSYVP